jgi:tryptophan synthase beta chain
MRIGRDLGPDAIIVVNLSGRGDKDVATAARWFGLDPVDEAAEGR